VRAISNARSSVLSASSRPPSCCFVDALLQHLPVELRHGVEEFLAPARLFAGNGLAGEFLQRRDFVASFEMFQQAAGGDVGTRADQRDQFGQQFDAGMAQRDEAIRRLQFQRQRWLLQQQGDGVAHQAALRRVAGRRIAQALHRHVGVGGAAARTDAGEFSEPLPHQVTESAVGNLRQHRLGAFG